MDRLNKGKCAAIPVVRRFCREFPLLSVCSARAPRREALSGRQNSPHPVRLRAVQGYLFFSRFYAGGAAGRETNFTRTIVLRDEINTALKEALKAQDKLRTSTLRLVNAALKDRDIEARGHGKDPLGDDDLRSLLAKMVKQREESAKIYAENARPELAEQERAEIAVIQDFLPKQLSEAESRAIITALVAEIEAKGIKDMGRTISVLKERYAGAMDFGKASALVKEALTAGA